MANPSKKKGTAGETELLAVFKAYGYESIRRTPAGARYDLETDGFHPAYKVLAIRPDRGQWLFVIDQDVLFALLDMDMHELQIEVKRRAKSALHTMWQEEMDW